MKIQIIGGNGMLGKAVLRAAIRSGVSISPKHSVDITSVKPTSIDAPTVINCGSILGAGKSLEVLEAVNTKGPHLLAAACDEVGARLIHVSTDAVFHSPGVHTEDDTPEPTDAFGRSKLLGEVTRSPHLSVRVAFIGLGLHGVIAELARATNPVRASNQLLWSGHTVDTVAEALLLLAARPDVTGLIHVPGEGISRWQMVTAIIAELGLSEDLVHRDDSKVADRRLGSLRWKMLGLPTFPPLSEQLHNLLQSPACKRYLQSLPIPSSV